MNILFLRGFNNYFNRIVKKYSTLADYRTNSNTYLDIGNINFNPNDGVVTELIIGGPTQQENDKPLDWENIGSPDYAVCYETGVNNSTTIISRWYVLESVRMRNGQYRLALKRDSIVDHLNSILNAPIFVEKGMISDPTNPLIFNKESMTFNQIKESETLLQDPTKSAWLVGYIEKDNPDSSTSITSVVQQEEGAPISYVTPEELPFEFNINGNQVIAKSYSISTWTGIGLYTSCAWFDLYDSYYHDNYYGFGLLKTSYNKSSGFNRNFEFGGWGYTGKKVSSYNYDRSGSYSNLNSDVSGTILPDLLIAGANGQYVRGLGTPTGFSYSPSGRGSISLLVDQLQNVSPSSNFNSTERLKLDNFHDFIYDYYSALPDNEVITSLSNKVLKVGNKYYSIIITRENYTIMFKDSNFTGSFVNVDGDSPFEVVTVNQANTSLSVPFNAAYGSNRTYQTNILNAAQNGIKNSAFTLERAYRYTIRYGEVGVINATATIPASSNRTKTYNAVFDMFAIPFGNINFQTSSASPTYTTYKHVGLGIAREIMEALGAGAAYDLQILPYCPSQNIRDAYESEGILNLEQLNSKSYTVINVAAEGSSGSASPGSFIIWCSSNVGEFDINIPINRWNGLGYTEAVRKKISNETLLCRLVSPNFSGQFEFSLAKNEGVAKFNVDYTYQPYTPYIHVNPEFKGIYGQDWNDARGLICGGDFSIQFNDDAWATYQLQNKNFQQIFDRSIQNLDVNNSIAMEQQKLSAGLGAVQGGLSGAIGGAVAGAAGGIPGMIAGALIGGTAGAVTSGIAGQKDTEFLERAQSENRQYSVDQYGYQLGNIQALPQSIRGTNALTNNNKLWPLVEIYSATQTEINLLIQKIKYDGMTIMAIGNISDYSSTADFEKAYFKGKVIRLEDINDDMHIADDIYNEINKGIYIPEGGLS